MTNEDIYLEKEIVTLQDYSHVGVKKGDKGIITAYLPKDKIFAIWFGSEKWIMFYDEEEKTFLEKIKLC